MRRPCGPFGAPASSTEMAARTETGLACVALVQQRERAGRQAAQALLAPGANGTGLAEAEGGQRQVAAHQLGGGKDRERVHGEVLAGAPNL